MWKVGYSRACFDDFLGISDVDVKFASAHIIEPQDRRFDYSLGGDIGYIDCVDETITSIFISFKSVGVC